MQTTVIEPRLWHENSDIRTARTSEALAHFLADLTAAFGVVMLFVLLASGMIAFR